MLETTISSSSLSSQGTHELQIETIPETNESRTQSSWILLQMFPAASAKAQRIRELHAAERAEFSTDFLLSYVNGHLQTSPPLAAPQQLGTPIFLESVHCYTAQIVSR